MPQGPELQNEFGVEAHALDETPARFLDFAYWPRREFIRKPVDFCEWFDWSELFAEGADRQILSISKAFSSSKILIACMLTDVSEEIPQTLNTIALDPKDRMKSYYTAIWDQRSLPPPAPIAAAARTVMVWDSTEKWIIVNDRYRSASLLLLPEVAMIQA
jgi:hypothetical protein